MASAVRGAGNGRPLLDARIRSAVSSVQPRAFGRAQPDRGRNRFGADRLGRARPWHGAVRRAGLAAGRPVLLVRRCARSGRRAAEPAAPGSWRGAGPVAASAQGGQRNSLPVVPAGAAQALAAAETRREASAPPTSWDATALLA